MTALDTEVVYCLMLLESKKKLEYTDPLNYRIEILKKMFSCNLHITFPNPSFQNEVENV